MGLSILRYDPNDHKLEETLSLQHGVSVEDSDSILKIISLYLSWKNRSSINVFTSKEKSSVFTGDLTIDEEERVPTQLFVSVEEPNLEAPPFIYIRINLFENCYECELSVIEDFMEDGKKFFITEMPQKFSVVKERKLTRFAIDESSQKTISINEQDFRISVVGPQSLVIAGIPQQDTFQFVANGKTFKGKCVRKFEGSSVIVPLFESPEESGDFFMFYASEAYPTLQSATGLKHDTRFELYNQAGYFNMFSDDDREALRSKIANSWELLFSLQHVATVDLVSFKDGQPQGCSSLAKPFSENAVDTWVFHQLCAIKEESNLELTRDLYKWRAEYIASRPGAIKTKFWFRSKSRWLERIYVKFGMSKTKKILTPVVLKAVTAEDTREVKPEWSKDAAVSGRFKLDSDNFCGGFGPEYFNASRLLNMVYSNQPCSEEDITSVALSAGQKYMVTCRPNIDGEVFEDALPSDRMASLDKEDMIDFIACLEHSIAITIKKGPKTA